MSQTITIYISADTLKLKQLFPDGGDITDHTIIVMTDSNDSPVYESIFRDKLITSAQSDDAIKWVISSGTERVSVSFTEFRADQNASKVFINTPTKNPSNPSEFDAQIKSGIKGEIDTEYFLSFCINSDERIVWTWDPMIKVRY
ncbi:MAG: hypothetical protein JEZ09_04635 [Salinivirgaceae bacterium]|nr:hypothetical protein [Salinivirgaceae bacterium]